MSQSKGRVIPFDIWKMQGFGDLQNKFGDLSHDENLIKFFNEVLSRRDEIDKLDPDIIS